MINIDVFASREGEFVDVEVRLSTSGGAFVPAQVPTAFILLIDTSRSMGEFDKLGQAVEAAKNLIENMGDDDLVAVYTFDEKIKTVMPLVEAGKAKNMLKRLDKIKVGSYTFLYQAVVKAVEDLRKGAGGMLSRGRVLEGYVKRVIVLTDGEPYPYYTEEHWYETLGRSAASFGIAIIAIGIGYDYNEKILYKLTSSSGGTWYHISKLSNLADVLSRELKRAREIAIKRPLVKIETEAEVVKTEKLGATVTSLGAAREVQLEDLSLGEVASVVFKLKPSGPLSAEVIVVTEEGEIRRKVTEANIGEDRTATLTMQLAEELEKAAAGGVVRVEVLETVEKAEVLPGVYREKATRLKEAVQRGDQKEIIHESTTVIYPLPGIETSEVTRPLEMAQATETLPQETPRAATGQVTKCVITCEETGKSMEVSLPALLGRQDLLEIIPQDKASYISRRQESRAHIEIFTKEGEVYIRDAGSKGGVYVGGMRVAETKIGPETTVNLGGVVNIKIRCST